MSAPNQNGAEARDALEDIVRNAPNIGVWPYSYKGDRRRMDATTRRMEDTHVTIRTMVELPADSQLARDVAAALVETLARFGL